MHQMLSQFKDGDKKLLISYRPRLLPPRCKNSVRPETKISTLFLFYFLHIMVNFMEKEPCFVHFSRSYEVTKF